MDRASYCDVHGTYPLPSEPCWQCANPFIEKATALLEQQVERLEERLLAVLDVAVARGEKLGYEDADYRRDLEES
jgi:hypothetical protein